MKRVIEGARFEEERSLYGLKEAVVRACRFEGEKDGESPLKEGRDLLIEGCEVALRYPFWHLERGEIVDTRLDERARAGLWHAKGVTVRDSELAAVKFLRECKDVRLEATAVKGDEFGWKSRGIVLKGVTVESQQAFLDSSRIEADDLELVGKYSLQYIEDSTFRSSSFSGRDAFWHAKNVTVVDSTLRGEYLAWYSENLTLIRCRIDSHQPLCYCKNLTLVDCRFGEESDLAFENSEVRGNVVGPVPSIKNLRAGEIRVGKGTAIVEEADVYPIAGKIIVEE